MKHERNVTLILILIFLLSQLIGLALLGESMEMSCQQISENVEECSVVHEHTVVGARPETEGASSVAYILLGIAFGTGILLLIIKFGRRLLWKIWFFFAVMITIAISIGVILPNHLRLYAWIIAFLIAVWKLFKPNILIYNLAEVLMYGGMAVLLVPLLYVNGQSNEAMSVWPALVILGLISIYDMIAVWKSKHMVKMAEFITSSNSFAGLMIPYDSEEKKIEGRMPGMGAKGTRLVKGEKSTKKNAILGGGDITFPLLFSGVVFQARVVESVRAGMTFTESLVQNYWGALTISLGATLAIALLFIFAKKDKFYPAMPFVTAGCLVGWAVSFLL